MNKEIKELLNKIKDDLLKEPIVQEYIRLKELLEKSEELSSLRKHISYLQNCRPTDEGREEYYKLLKQYNDDPLVIQFRSVSDEVYDLLEEIKKELEI